MVEDTCVVTSFLVKSCLTPHLTPPCPFCSGRRQKRRPRGNQPPGVRPAPTLGASADMSDSTKPALPSKPSKAFPLYVHKSDRWAKKVLGKTEFFGKASTDPTGEAALAEWLRVKDHLLAGRKRPEKSGGVTVGLICNDFLRHKKELLATGEITARTWFDYKSVTDVLVDAFGATRPVDDLQPEDFGELRSKLAKRLGLVALGNTIQRVRSVFRYADLAGLIERQPKYGPGFARPSKKALRKSREDAGSRMLSADELRKLIDAAGTQLKSMLLLAANCGLGNGDIAAMKMGHVDLGAGWLRYKRPKTGVDRRAKLWPETIQALRDALAKRPTPKNEADSDLFFVTKYGHGWGKLGRFKIDEPSATNPSTKKAKGVNANNGLAKEFRKLTRGLGIARSFYDLRHVYRTQADEAKDQPAIDLTMGHASDSMASVYRETISDERIAAVATVVRAWLYPAVVAAEKVDIAAKAVSEAKTSRKPRKKQSAPKSRETLRIVG